MEKIIEGRCEICEKVEVIGLKGICETCNEIIESTKENNDETFN